MAEQTQEKKHKKKSNGQFMLGFFALLLAIALVSVGITLAAQQGSSNGTNIVTIGQVKIELLVSSTDMDKAQSPAADPSQTAAQNGEEEEDLTEVQTEGQYSKYIAVKNTGNYPCYVRLLVKKEWYIPDADPHKVEDIYRREDLTRRERTSRGIIHLNINENYWTRGDDYGEYECYYYNMELPKGETTPALCETFSMAEFGPEYNTLYGNIKVMAHAVQSEYVTTKGDDATVKIEVEQTPNGPKQKITAWHNLAFD